ncbi:DUF397 domain-containing protein [Streptomyces aurantiacus]|uniref:DUF397 domain-containing protein n=1 Tax=Streptomyces aurantiacus TaxID=47760 RepID=A0A7G1P5J2_9ACTN|nr:DUF397 domain-containing protein [Streptomyces aurantiacus]BCL29087.1 hypothetical protein GCM10017557_39460 [Streptomyces aurantiacus]
MPTATWQKSSYCGEGESCIHVTSESGALRLTESGDPAESILGTTSPTFGALISVLKAKEETRPN